MFSFYSTLCTELYDYTKPVGYSLNGDIEYYEERLKNALEEFSKRQLDQGVLSSHFLRLVLQLMGLTIRLKC